MAGAEENWGEAEAVRLLNEAKTDVDADGKVEKLQQIEELVLRKEPGLAVTYVPHLLELQVERHSAVRKWVADFCERAATVPGGTELKQCISTVSALIRDESAAVAKRALQAAVPLFRYGLLAARDRPNEQGTKEAWQAASRLKDQIVTVVMTHQNQGARLQAVKFIEAVAALFSTADGHDDPAIAAEAYTTDSFEAESIEANHPLISKESILQDAERLVSLIASLAKPSSVERSPGPFTIVVITALSNLARCRPVISHKALPPLVELAKANFSGNAKNLSAQAASIRHNVKHALISILKGGGEGSLAHRDSLTSALEAIGAGSDAESAVRYADKLIAKKRSRERDNDQQRKHAKLEPEDPSRLTVEAHGEPNAAAISLPSSVSEGQENEQPQFEQTEQPTIRQWWEMYEPEHDEPALTEFSALNQLAETVAPLGTSPNPPLLDSVIQQLPHAVLADFVLYNLSHLPRESSHHEEQGPSAGKELLEMLQQAVQVPAQSHLRGKDDRPDRSAPTAGTGPPVEPLSNEQARSQRKAALERISRLPGKGAGELRAFLLSRLASSAGSDEENGNFLERPLLDSTLEEDSFGPHDHALAVQWLYSLLAAQEGQGGAPYERVFSQLVAGIQQRTSVRDRALSRFLVEAPYIPPSSFDVLRRLCSLPTSQEEGATRDANVDADRLSLGLTTLRDLIFERPSCREACLELVLDAALHSREAVRGKALRLIGARLVGVKGLHEQIVEKATSELDALCSDVDLPETEEEAVKEGIRRSSLFCVVCSRVPSLLPRLYSAYATAPALHQRALVKNLPGLVQAVGPKDEVKGALDDPPEGSEELAVETAQALLDCFPEVQDELYGICQGLFERKGKDPRFLVPILPAARPDDARALVPNLVHLDQDKLRMAIHKLVHGSQHQESGPLSAVELLVALHNVPMPREVSARSLKPVIEACNTCFQMRSVFPPEVLSATINQLAEQVPLPVTFMRSMIQAHAVAPRLKGFLLEVCERLVSKQVWKQDSRLWDGFLLFASRTLPESCSVLTSLPPQQLELAFSSSKFSGLRSHLQRYLAHNPGARSSVPRATLNVIEGEQNPE